MGHESSAEATGKKARFKLLVPRAGPLNAGASMFALLLLLGLVAKGQGYQPDLGRHHKVKHGRRVFGTSGPVKRSSEPLKTIHLAGIFPINGVEGWQGGQVGPKISLVSQHQKSVNYSIGCYSVHYMATVRP